MTTASPGRTPRAPRVPPSAIELASRMDYKPEPETKPEDRIEWYLFTRPNGKAVTIEHNLETGETKVVGKEA